ncbi:hypothetical protein B4N89_35005 [Embleya scabrispora]|uniref:Uncharacterized protein n=1 Tax=Embleya scabrispora TaxID=159449 RepID=A0A1T3NQV4_9ACTN|nr:hypothetical protein [Embleya scabrispora]OPC79267.1 hypothetical protein B4N89_35005 [Embleya scabrispora]
MILSALTFSLTPKPWDTMSWVEVPDGLEFVRYEITTIPAPRRPEVEATPDEENRWALAARDFEKELLDAQSDVRREHGIRTKPRFMADTATVRLWRYSWFPNRRARSRRSWERCVARMRAAEERYRPTREEIEARVAATKAREN